MKTKKTAKTNSSILHQVIQLIPKGLPDKIASEKNVDIRKFSCTSHVAALMYAHIAHVKSLNEICDGTYLHEKELTRIRSITIPKRNTLSNANRTRNPEVAEELYWQTLKEFQRISPTFKESKKHKGFIHIVKRDIFAMDSSTLALSLNSIDWAKHRAKKAAAKVHMKLDICNMLPSYVIVEEASHHDSTRAANLCSSLKSGDVLLADRAYVKFDFLFELEQRDITFVLREKSNCDYEVIKNHQHKNQKIISDEIIILKGKQTSTKYPKKLRRVVARVEVDGKERELVFITNNFKWSPKTISELYKSRWAIEVFFKELKQNLQFDNFFGYNENAVKWQVWTGLLTHLILRFIKHISNWKHSFSRLFGIIRSGLWLKLDLLPTLNSYGIAADQKEEQEDINQLILKGFG